MSADSDSIDRFPRSSYYDSDYRQSAALLRARKPYLIPNIIGGVTVVAFTLGVCEWPGSYLLT